MTKYYVSRLLPDGSEDPLEDFWFDSIKDAEEAARLFCSSNWRDNGWEVKVDVRNRN